MSSPQTLTISSPGDRRPVSRTITRRLFASSGKVSLYQCAGVLLGFAFQAFLSRVCGADALGALTLFLSWLGIFSVLTVPGLEGSIVYFLPRMEGDAGSSRHLIRQCLIIAGAASLMVAAALWLTGPRLFARIGLPDQACTAFCIALVAFSVGKLLDAVFLAFNDAPAQGYFNIVRTLTRFLFCLPVFLAPSARWTILFSAVAAESILTVFLRCLRMRRYFHRLRITHATSYCATSSRKTLLAFALPMLGISVIDIVYPLLDKAVLGVMVPLALVGIYRIGDSIAAINTMFVSPFISFWPYISQLHGQERLNEVRDSYRTITLFIIAVMIPFSLMLIELSPLVLSIFGPAFVAQGRNIFLVLAFGTAIDAIAGPAGAVLKLTGHPRLSLTINTAWLVLYFSLTVFLAHRYGILGAAFAKMISTVFGNLANLAANRLLLGIFPYTAQHAWLLLAAAAIISVRWLLFPTHPGVGGQFLTGLGESVLFVGFSAFLLRHSIRRLLPHLLGYFTEGSEFPCS
jgi:O-antigen/teichoic acid export membrane protein